MRAGMGLLRHVYIKVCKCIDLKHYSIISLQPCGENYEKFDYEQLLLKKTDTFQTNFMGLYDIRIIIYNIYRTALLYLSNLCKV